MLTDVDSKANAWVECGQGHVWPRAKHRECPVCGAPATNEPVRLHAGPPFFFGQVVAGIGLVLALYVAWQLTVWLRSPQRVHAADVISIAYSADGALWTAGTDGVVHRWDPATGAVQESMTVRPNATRLAVSPDGGHYLLVEVPPRLGGPPDPESLHVWARGGAEPLWSKSANDIFFTPGFSADGRWVHWHEFSRVYWVAAETGQPGGELHAPQGHSIAAHAFSPDGTRLAILTRPYDDTLTTLIVYSVAGLAEQWRSPLPDLGDAQVIDSALSFTDGDDQLVCVQSVGNERSVILVLDVATGEPLAPPATDSGGDLAAMFDRSTRELQIINAGGTRRRLRPEGDRWIEVDAEPLGVAVHAAAFSPDRSGWVATGGRHTVWERPGGRQMLFHATRSTLPKHLIAPLVLLPLLALAYWFGSLIRRAMHAHRSRQMREVAQRVGLTYVPQPSARLVERLQIPALLPSQTQYWLQNVCQGRLDGREVVGCVLTTRRRRRKHANVTERVVLLFPLTDVALPSFKLSPENVLDRLVDTITGADIDLDGSDAAREFSRRYCLLGDDPVAVRELFNESLLGFFAESPGWTVQAAEGLLSFQQALPSPSWRNWREYLNHDPQRTDPGLKAASWLSAAVLAREFLRGRSE